MKPHQKRFLNIRYVLYKINLKNSKLRNIIDIFPSYYAKKNKIDDLLTIIEGFNRIFVLNIYGDIFVLDFANFKLTIKGKK